MIFWAGTYCVQVSERRFYEESFQSFRKGAIKTGGRQFWSAFQVNRAYKIAHVGIKKIEKKLQQAQLAGPCLTETRSLVARLTRRL